MVGGLAVYGAAQALADGTRLDELPTTSLGLALVAQAAPGLVAAACVEAALLARGRLRTWSLSLATDFAAVTILVHVLTTHAASSHSPWLEVAVQSKSEASTQMSPISGLWLSSPPTSSNIAAPAGVRDLTVRCPWASIKSVSAGPRASR